MPDVWTVQVAGQNYGPYPLEHMQAFIAEGRIVATSLVAYGDDTQFHFAGEDLVLGRLIAPAPESTPEHVAEPVSEPVHEPEPEYEQPQRPKRIDPALQRFGNIEEDDEPRHVLVITDLKSCPTTGIEEAIHKLGPTFAIMPQVWLVMTTESVNGIRKMLSMHVGSVDPLFVVDTTHDQAAWHNFGPGPESRIRGIWGKDQRKAS